jgi:hypothetical protein
MLPATDSSWGQVAHSSIFSNNSKNVDKTMKMLPAVKEDRRKINLPRHGLFASAEW